MRRRARLKLYWCWTDDHDEDWFVVARRLDESLRFFVHQEGYGKEDVRAQLVCALPDHLQQESRRGWPDRKVLQACGATIVRWQTPRVIDLRGRRWVEGMLEHQLLEATDDACERRGQGRPNRTTRSQPS